MQNPSPIHREQVDHLFGYLRDTKPTLLNSQLQDSVIPLLDRSKIEHLMFLLMPHTPTIKIHVEAQKDMCFACLVELSIGKQHASIA
jgi:hypothetical protein